MSYLAVTAKKEKIMKLQALNDLSTTSTPLLSSGLLMPYFVAGGAEAKANLDQFVSRLELLPYLEAEPSKLITWPGHPTLICKIASGNWKTDPIIQDERGLLIFSEPSWHFDIHFELQVQLWKSALSLYLHYETNPFFSRARLASNADPASLEQYHQLRKEFLVEMMAACHVPGFQLCDRPVQIGKANLDFSNNTVDEAATMLQPIIDEVACAINSALHRPEQHHRNRHDSNYRASLPL